MAGRIHAEDRRPYFFLSYARSRFRPEDSDPDRWVTKFFNDLRADVNQLTSAPVPGFMDRQIPIGTQWPDHLANALTNCRVFVPLFSPGYFRSEYCGREWAAFLERAEPQRTAHDLPTAIIPVFWSPMAQNELPDLVHSLQNLDGDFPAAYVAEGLYGIMKLGRYRERYKETVWRLATLIKDRADDCALEARPVRDLHLLPNPFARDAPPEPHRPVRLTLAAQGLDDLPSERNTYYYGYSAREWNPYRSGDHTTPMGTYAQQVLGELGHDSLVDSVDDPLYVRGDTPNVLIADPWATKEPELGRLLREIDTDPVNVLSPFNSQDAQTMTAADELAGRLEDTLGHSLALNGSATNLDSVEAFRDALPKAANEAITRYFKTAPAHPPGAPPTMSRPRLRGPQT